VTRHPAQTEEATAVREEQLIFESRRNSVRSKTESLKQGRTLIDNEISALAAKDTSLARQLALALSERENVKSLVGRGLVVSNRQLSTEQNVAQMEAARLDIGVARLRAEQDKAKLDRDIMELQDQRRAEILLELRHTEGKLQESQERILTSGRLAFNAEVLAPSLENDSARRLARPPRMVVFRADRNGSFEIEASYATELAPGDIVQIMKLPFEELPDRTSSLGPRQVSRSGAVIR
jgi:exopolysaccharide production protein ExoF